MITIQKLTQIQEGILEPIVQRHRCTILEEAKALDPLTYIEKIAPTIVKEPNNFENNSERQERTTSTKTQSSRVAAIKKRYI